MRTFHAKLAPRYRWTLPIPELTLGPRLPLLFYFVSVLFVLEPAIPSDERRIVGVSSWASAILLDLHVQVVDAVDLLEDSTLLLRSTRPSLRDELLGAPYAVRL
jgi:hypothetical protein